MSPHELHSILSRVLRASLLSAVVLTSACGKSEIDRDGFDSPAFCTTESSSPEALRVALGVDWLAFVNGTGSFKREAGTRCAGATDLACTKKVDDAEKAGDGALSPGQSGGSVLITTKGNDVRVVKTRAELVALFGTIDSPAKVFHLMWADGYSIQCDRWVRTTSDGFEAIGRKTTADCDPIIEEEHRVAVRRDGTITVVERVEVDRTEGACIGRRPAGLVTKDVAEPGSRAGAWFARAAQLEAASVDAFRILAGELVAHGAPSDLVADARRSAREEIRHAAVMTRLAHRYGASFELPVVAPRACRPLFELALENAVEGCVRETYGAIEAALQAELAADPAVARAMRMIAKDEARHAELSWRIAAWAREKLDDDERRAIDDAMHAAARDLAREAARDVSAEVATIAGLPTPAVATAAVERLATALWA